jgi:GDP-mannose 6-dehydrogenase
VSADQTIASPVAVLGLGYVGCVTSACLADLGHRVTGVDTDEYKVRSVLDGRSPFYEPGLEDLVKRNRAAGRLSATTSLAEALADAGIAFLCVGTPSQKNGDMSLDQLQRVATEIGGILRTRASRLIVVVRSTVFPGTCENVVAPLLGGGSKAPVVANPEFLREGAAVRDFLEPSLIVVGGGDAPAVETVAGLYRGLGVQVSRVSTRTAEMIKYACNAFHAVKVGFANEIGALCSRMDVSAQEVMATLCRDTKLNISSAYLKPGFAFGGSCLPKDLRAIAFRAMHLDLKLPLLESVLPANSAHLDRAIDDVLDLPAERLGVFGLAFKENTDDLRESPVVRLVEHLIGKGRTLRIFDPHIQLEGIYGSNRDFILNAVPHIGKLLERSLAELIARSDHLVIAQNPSFELRAQMRASGLPILDLTGSLAS